MECLWIECGVGCSIKGQSRACSVSTFSLTPTQISFHNFDNCRPDFVEIWVEILSCEAFADPLRVAGSPPGLENEVRNFAKWGFFARRAMRALISCEIRSLKTLLNLKKKRISRKLCLGQDAGERRLPEQVDRKSLGV